MKINIAFKNNYAVSEVVGGLFLVLMAVISFTFIYFYFFNPLGPDYHESVWIEGSVEDDGLIVLEHVGGNSLESYKVVVLYTNGTIIGTKICENDFWKIGEYRYPLENIILKNGTTTDIRLINENISITLFIININEDGSEQEVFTWTPCGKTSETSTIDTKDPMLISSLRTDTTDEDLICFNYTLTPQINALTYIYNWIVDGNSITDILIPFDTNKTDTVRDYSGDENSGTIFGPTWNSNGIVGGTYQFDGNDDYILLPYCFEGSYIDEFTMEVWIKTSSDNMVLASYDNYWELVIRDGVIRFSSTANGDTVNLNGVTAINDNIWHHLAVTYDFSSGDCVIYLDGQIEKNENCHDSGEELGSGSNPSGNIGTGDLGIFPGTWILLTYDDFEGVSDFTGTNYTDGGRDCFFYTGGTYAHQGDNAVNIQDNRGYESSFYHTNAIDVDSPGYISIKVDFWFRAAGMESGEDFWVRYFDGTQWRTVADYDYGDEFVNGQFYHEIVWINETDYTFPSNMKIQFQCDAGSDLDDIYIDQIYVNATTGDITIGNFSGMIDEFHIFNRALSGEQIFQNYLCSRDGETDISVIVSEETILGDIWRCIVTPNDSNQDDDAVQSNSLQIVGYKGV